MKRQAHHYIKGCNFAAKFENIEIIVPRDKTIESFEFPASLRYLSLALQ